MTTPLVLPLRLVAIGALLLASCTSAGTHASTPSTPQGTPKVGPPRGSVLVVGGGGQGPEIFAKFVELAGGPDALIIDVPAAGGDTAYPPDWRGTRGLKEAGAKHVMVLHTNSRKIADSDSFIAPLARAGGVWFEGGRQFHLVDLYAGTKTERAFHQILERGGVAGGSSAGASILGSYMVRGAPSSDNRIMAYPGYETGFGFLRGVAIDQHVVARERLADLADSIMPRHPEILGISEDEGTAWVVQGDIAQIIGRDKAFVYGGKDPNDPGKPFLTLHPGDTYNLATRHVVRRAIQDSPLTHAFIDSLFADFGKPGAPVATVLVAQDGKVFIDASYGIPPQARYMPTTTVPNFPLGGLSDGFNASAALSVVRDGKLTLDDPLSDSERVTVRQFLARPADVPDGNRQLVALLTKRSGTPYVQLIARRIMAPIGMHKTVADSTTGLFQSNVDELYRWELGLSANTSLTEAGQTNLFTPVNGAQTGDALGWRVDDYRGLPRQSEYGTPDGKRNAFVRFPGRRASIIILTSGDTADVRSIADRIADRLLFSSAGGAAHLEKQ